MDFDKSKVYTALNADEVKVGSKGYFADSLSALGRYVINDNKSYFFTVKEILEEDEVYRFMVDNLNDEEVSWNLFYLVEEPEEKTIRPYKDTDEMIEDFKRRYNSYGGWSGKDNPMYCPLIWVQTACGNKKLVTNIDNDSVYLQKWVSLPEFAEAYTYLDGSPCGIEE